MDWLSLSLYAIGSFATLYIVYGAVLYALQSRLVFMPSRSMCSDPSELGLEFERVSFKSLDGASLAGWFVPADGKAKHTVLFCPGNAGNISHYLETVKSFHSLGVDFFIFNYRGYGDSQGLAPTEEGMCMDAESAWTFLTEGKGVQKERLLLVGRSLGAAVAVELAKRRSPKALVLESPFLSIPHMAAKLHPFFPSRMLARTHFDSLAKIPGIVCPTLVMHSPTDRIIPFWHGEALFHASGGSPKEFIALTGPHNDCYFVSGRTYLDALGKFIDESFS